MEYIVVGTAGHVDHGKTVLVQALTGHDTDRLKEEKERGISIELGFAPLRLPSGRTLGLVDVPGHERFIRQMLAGVGGIDLVLLVVAADEGVMPQTREHLEIINLLRINRGIIVLTKIDLVDQDWLELVREEVREAVRDTVLAEAPLVAVSAVTGEGLSELVALLDEIAAATPSKSTSEQVRLPIDRVFTITGFGTVVTGTLWSGTLRVGDNLEILPEAVTTRARNLQVHGQAVTEAKAGQRVAVNLAGLEVSQIGRGSVLLAPGLLTPSFLIDTRLRLLPTAPKNLVNRARVRFYLGTSEILGRVVLLDREELAPGEEAFVQLAMETPVVSAKNDRFILRSYSPMRTIGGGVVVDPRAVKHKRFRVEVLESLETKLHGSPAELIIQALEAVPRELLTVESVAAGTGISLPELRLLLEEPAVRSEVQVLPGEGVDYLLTGSRLGQWAGEVQVALDSYHRQYHLRPGISKEELRSRLFPGISLKGFNALLQEWTRKSTFRNIGSFIALPDFVETPTPGETALLDQISRAYEEGWYQPPGWAQLQKDLGLSAAEGEELLQYLLRQGRLVRVAEGLYYSPAALRAAQEKIAAFLQHHDMVSLAEVRDLLSSSRKYILPLLEYFDTIKFTRRQGDRRTLGSRPGRDVKKTVPPSA